MSVNDFSEKDIRTKILKKVKPTLKKGRAKHAKGKVIINGQIVAIVKIPNDHKRIMKNSKSKYIAQSLLLTPDEFNQLISCTMGGQRYYKTIEDQLNL